MELIHAEIAYKIQLKKVYHLLQHAAIMLHIPNIPQISYLKEMYEEGPSSIFVLPFRNVTDWIRSVTNWNRPTLRKRMADNCEFPAYNLTKGWGTDKDFEDLYCKHVKHIRQFVKRRPTLTLVEYLLSREDVGDYLTSALPHMNKNGLIMVMLMRR